jgi:hypothetical protein
MSLNNFLFISFVLMLCFRELVKSSHYHPINTENRSRFLAQSTRIIGHLLKAQELLNKAFNVLTKKVDSHGEVKLSRKYYIEDQGSWFSI